MREGSFIVVNEIGLHPSRIIKLKCIICSNAYIVPSVNRESKHQLVSIACNAFRIIERLQKNRTGEVQTRTRPTNSCNRHLTCIKFPPFRSRCRETIKNRPSSVFRPLSTKITRETAMSWHCYVGKNPQECCQTSRRFPALTSGRSLRFHCIQIQQGLVITILL